MTRDEAGDGRAAITFTLAGARVRLNREDVRTALRGREPGPISLYWVEVDGVRWPVKQALSVVTGIATRAFGSASARRHLAKLGFRVERKDGRGRHPPHTADQRAADRTPPVPSAHASRRREAVHDPDTDLVVHHLRDGTRAASLQELLSSRAAELRSPGLYSWWVDEAGAAELTRGLGHRVEPGLVYAGLAGATRKGGSRSSHTLLGRIATMHLGTRARMSTLRRSLGSILASADGWTTIDETRLSAWMHAHLRVVTILVDNADTLDHLESTVLAALDPPLNLAKVPKTPARRQLSALRRQYGG